MRGLRAALCYAHPQRAVKFYVEKCGFHEISNPQPPVDASPRVLRRGEADLCILAAESVSKTSPLGRRLGKSAGAGVRLDVPIREGESLQDLFVSLEQAGVDIVEPPGEWSPGERSFTIADPGNYLVSFVEPIAGR